MAYAVALNGNVSHWRSPVDPGVLPVLVVLANKDDRQFPDGGQIEALVEGADIRRPVAENRYGYGTGAEHLRRQRGPRPDRDPRPDDGHRRQQAHGGVAEVHRPPEAAHTADLTTEDLSQYGIGCGTEGEGHAMAPVGAGDGVARLCYCRYAHTYGLLALRGVRGAGYETLAEEFEHPVFDDADLDHAPEAFDPA